MRSITTLGFCVVAPLSSQTSCLPPATLSFKIGKSPLIRFTSKPPAPKGEVLKRALSEGMPVGALLYGATIGEYAVSASSFFSILFLFQLLLNLQNILLT